MRVNPGSRVGDPARRIVLLGLGAVGLSAVAGYGPSGPDAAKTPAEQPAPRWGRTPTRADEILFERPGEGVSCLAFSTDGRTLALGRQDRRVVLWDPATGKMIG